MDLTTRQRNFWLTVRDCLIIIHGRDFTRAVNLVSDFSHLFNSRLIYEQEPFWVACAMTHEDLDIREWLPRYLVILAIHDRP